MNDRLHIRDNRNGQWYFVDNDLLKRFGTTIGVYGIAVYNVLAMYANNETQETYPSYTTIADLIGCSRRKVVTVMDQLTKHNIIAKTHRKAKSGLYDSNIIILLHKDQWRGSAQDSPGVVNEVHHPSAQDSPGVVNEVHRGSESDAPKQDSVNKTQKNKTHERETRTPPGGRRLSKNLKPAAVHVYREVVKRCPPEATWPMIDEAVGSDPEALDYWKEIVTAWIAVGWKDSNVAGMLERFKNRDMPATSKPEAAQSGGHPAQTVQEMVRQQAPSSVTGEF